MISFSKLGSYGRLGNQLFQYAFLRTQARRINTGFYCPEWIGDKIFNLDDSGEKVSLCNNAFLYTEKGNGFSPDVIDIRDGTEIVGFFQSDKYFSKTDVLQWFSFKNDFFKKIDEKYKDIDFSKTTAIHIRLGDYLEPQLVFYVPRVSYFRKSLNILNQKDNILVFSDDIKSARRYLKKVTGSLVYIEGNCDFEDLYLMSKCKNIICSPSSFSWWAAYLNKRNDKKVIVPQYWFLPGGKAINKDIFVDDWVKIKAHNSVFDNYYFKFLPCKMLSFYKLVTSVFQIIRKKGIRVFFAKLKSRLNY